MYFYINFNIYNQIALFESTLIHVNQQGFDEPDESNSEETNADKSNADETNADEMNADETNSDNLVVI